MLDLITQVWNAITSDALILQFWANSSTPELRLVRLFYDMPDRDEPFPYINYYVKGAAHPAEWPMRDERLAFSIYDYYSTENTAMQIAKRILQICTNRIWIPSTSSAAGCRTWGVIDPPYSVPTQNKLAVRIDFALSLRWYDSEVADSTLTGGTR